MPSSRELGKTGKRRNGETAKRRNGETAKPLNREKRTTFYFHYNYSNKCIFV